jgi:2-polyprenyl-6-methoxyphenol hydroxylase-like FAD-dependent oxidoreductase
MRVGIIGGSIAGCATAALLHRAGHDVIVFERSESDLVSRGAGIGTPAGVWQDMMAYGLIDETLPACRADYGRIVTRGSGTGQQRWLGDIRSGSSMRLLNWAHLYQCLRRGVPDELYRSAAAVELIEAGPDGTTLHLRPGGSLDFDLVVCADGYRSTGRTLIDPGATPHYRGIVVWRGLLPESDIGVDALDGCDLLRPGYQGGHGVLYYIPGSGQSAERGKRLLMWAYYLQVPEGALSSVLVDDQERQQSSSVPFGKVHPEVKAGFESRLADLLPPLLFELVQQSANSSIQAIYSVVPRSYARDRLCLVGDAGAVFPPFTGSGVPKAVANATSLVNALADAPAVDDALRRWSEAQLQVAGQVIPVAERGERSQVFEAPDLTTMPTAATNDWMSSAYSGYALTLPDV